MKYWDLAQGVSRLTRGASQVSSRATSTAVQNLHLRRARAAAVRGVLAPGDPSPPPGSPDHLDYRGIAGARELAALRDGAFSLGHRLDPRRGPQEQIGLPAEILYRHAAVIGPSGSGKTNSILLPWTASALRGGSSVVLVDVSGDLLDELAVLRQHAGPFNARVAKWDYTDPVRSVGWNWLASLHDDDAIASVTEALIGREKPNDPQPFFHQRDRRTLRGLLETVRATRPQASPGDLVGLLQDQQMLARAVATVAGSAGARRLNDVISLPATEFGRAISGVVNALEGLDHPGVRAVTSRAELDLDRIFDVPTLLVVVAPLHGTRTSEVLGSLMLSQVIRVLYRRFGQRTGTHAFLVVDEAPRLTSRINFEELLSVSRRARVSVCLAAQDVTQFGDEKDRTAVLSNCATYVTLPSSSETSAKYFAGRLGLRQQSVLGLSHSTGQAARQQSVTQSLEVTPVLGLREVMDPPWGPRTAIVHSQAVSGKPFLVDLTRPELP